MKPPSPKLPCRWGSIRLLSVLLPVLGANLTPSASAQEPVEYRISFPNRIHHEAEVEITFPAVEPGVLEVRMSRSSPGRYALHEFSKNVYGVTARDGRGRPLQVSRRDPHARNIHVPRGGGEVRFAYTLYGDRVDGTYTAVDETHAHLNMPATFAWAPGWELRPIRLVVDVPENAEWSVATQLFDGEEENTFTAPSLHYFLDSPTEASRFVSGSWSIGGRGSAVGSGRIRVALHHLGSGASEDRYMDGVERIVREAVAVWGEPPSFEGGSYTFLSDYLPWADGDGMEHRNSTILTSSASLDRALTGLLGTVAHEFFHAWNVERLRPSSLEPFDFTSANQSRELWFAEGFTSYYDDLLLVRAGLIDGDEYAERIGGTLDAVINAPGRQLRSPVEMSMQAPFVDAAVSVDPTNRPNTFLSYYTWGSAVALGLDLALRSHWAATLDEYMRALWSRYGRTEVPYTVEDLETVLAGMTEPAFARDFFDRFVRGREVPDYESLLSAAGLVVRNARAGAPFLGAVSLGYDDDGAVLRGPTLRGSPLYRAGLDRGDRILRIDGRIPRAPDVVEEILDEREPGDLVSVAWSSRGRRYSEDVRLDRDPRLEVVPVEETVDGDLSAEAEAFRRNWLSSKVRD